MEASGPGGPRPGVNGKETGLVPGRVLGGWRPEMKGTAIPRLRDLRLLDDDVLDRNVGVSPAAAGLYPLDSVDDVLAFHDLAEHAVAPALGAGRRVIQEVVVLEVDEELARGRMRLGSPRHGDGIAIVLEAVAGLVLDGLFGRLLAHSRLQAAPLGHETVDGADPHAVAPALGAGRHVVEVVVDEEVGEGLARVRMRRGRPRPVFVLAIGLEPVPGLVLDGPLGRLLAHVGLETAALDHESVDDAV